MVLNLSSNTSIMIDDFLDEVSLEDFGDVVADAWNWLWDSLRAGFDWLKDYAIKIYEKLKSWLDVIKKWINDQIDIKKDPNDETILISPKTPIGRILIGEINKHKPISMDELEKQVLGLNADTNSNCLKKLNTIKAPDVQEDPRWSKFMEEHEGLVRIKA